MAKEAGVEALIVRPNECPIDVFNRCIQDRYKYRVYRGGSFDQMEGDGHSAKRAYHVPSVRFSALGFRLLRRVP